MAKKKSVKTTTANATASANSKNYYVIQHVTIQEPQPGKFKIEPGKHDGIVWECHPRGSNTIQNSKKDFLKKIGKTSASYLTQEQIDDFLKYVEESDFRIKMPGTEWKKNFARRFQRFLERKGVTLEQIEAHGFNDPASKRWLRNLYKNGIMNHQNIRTLPRMLDLFNILGVQYDEDF